MSSLAVCVNPGSAFNCYWEMPFRKRARITMENLGDEAIDVYYQINYTLTDVPEDVRLLPRPVPAHQSAALQGRLHDPRRRQRAQGQYVGTYMAWGVNNTGWWGEGEIKFFIDGDGEFPTICGTGTEDYFCGAYNFDPGRSAERDRCSSALRRSSPRPTPACRR